MATQRKIGATLVLGGEREFSAAVSKSTKALSTLKSEMALVSKQFEGQENTLEALTAKHDVLSRSLEQAQKVETETSNALANSKKNYEESGRSLENFRTQLSAAQQALDRMKSSSSATDSEIEQQEQLIKELSTDVANAEKTYSRAGDAVENWQKKMYNAQADVVSLNHQLAENDKYMEEARTSTDGCAVSIDAYGKAVTASEKNTRVLNDSTQRAIQSLEGLSRGAATIKVLETVSQSVRQIAGEINEVSDKIVDVGSSFESAMSEVEAISGATGDELGKLTSKAEELGSTTKFTATEVGNAFKYMSLAGWDVEQSLDGIQGILDLSAASGMELAKASDMVTDYLSAFNLEAKDSSRIADLLASAQASANTSAEQLGEAYGNCATTLSAAGQSIETVTAVLEGMSNNGTKGAEAGTQLAAVMSQITAKMKDGAISIGETSIAVQDSNGNYRDLLDILGDVEKATEGMGTAEKAAALSAVFNRTSLKGLNTILNESIPAIRTYREGLDDATGAAHDMASTMQDNLQGQVTALNSALEGLGIEAYNGIAEPLTGGVKVLTSFVSECTKALKELPAPLKAVVSGVGLATAGIAKLTPSAVTLLTTVKQFKTANEMITALKAINNVGGSTAGAVGAVAEAVGDLTDAAQGAGAVADVADSIDDVTDVASDGTRALSGLGSAAGSAGTSFTGAGIAIAGVTAVVVGSIAAADALHKRIIESDEVLKLYLDTAEEATEATKELSESMKNVGTDLADTLGTNTASFSMATPLISELSKLQSQTQYTTADMTIMQGLVTKLNAIYPDLGLTIDSVTGKLSANGKEIRDISGYMDNYRDSIEKAAKTDALKDLYKNLSEAEYQLSKNKDEVESLTDEMMEYVNKGVVELDENGFMKSSSYLNFFSASDLTKFNEIKRKRDELIEQSKTLSGDMDDERERVASLEKELGIASSTLSDVSENAEDVSDAMASNNVIKQASDYEILAEKIKSVDGNLEEVAEAISSDEELTEEHQKAIQKLFENTVLAWQNYHDEITGGLSDELNSLTDSMHSWSDYKKTVLDALQSSSDLFKATSGDASVTWAEMSKNLTDNAQKYTQWNENVNAVLSSSRYANDEAFRSMANSIMTLGIDGSDYLQQFVQNLDASDEALAQWADMSSITDTYATNMANLQSATETSMSGIATAYDNTKTEAEQALSSLSQSIADQTQAYNDWYGNVQSIVDSEQYKTDSEFREFANSLMSTGLSGAKAVQDLWDGMQSGSEEVDKAVESYSSLKSAQGTYADAMASIQTTVQQGYDDAVVIVDNAGGALATAAANASDGINNIDLSQFVSNVDTASGDAVTSVEDASTKVDTTTADIINTITSKLGPESEIQQKAYSWGEEFGRNFASGLRAQIGSVSVAAFAMADSVSRFLHHTSPDEGPLAGDDKWGSEFGSQFASGIMDSSSSVQDAAKYFASKVADNFDSLTADASGFWDSASVSSVMRNNALANAMQETEKQYGNTINMTINGSEGQDIRELANLVTDRLKMQFA